MEENFKPLDLRKFQNTVQQESNKMNLKSFVSDGESSFTLALALCAAVKKIFYEKSEMTFSSEPKLKKKLVTWFAKKMRVDAKEKFNTTTVFSVIHFAADDEGLKRQEYMLTLVIFVEHKFLPEFLRLLQYPYIDADYELEVKDGCGTVVNLIGGQFKKEMAILGYKDMMMSPFESYINTAVDGVGIPQGSLEKYELSFEIEGIDRLSIEMITMPTLPKSALKEKKVIKRILVIDDDLIALKIIKPFLQSHGFEVVVAQDGNEGLARLKERPDLILLDLQMPIMDGYEFIFAMKKIEGIKRVPIIILTMREGLNDIVKVEGIKEYMIKPFQPEALLKSIQRYI